MRQLTVALVGNPNCGKSTLFNALTGSHQQVGNWPGVTIERKSGYFSEENCRVEVIDLPGTYSLTTVNSEQAIDTQIACEYLLFNRPDMVINVVDATHLERNLYLTLQLLEMRIPVIIVINMMDIAEKQKISIDINHLAASLGCPVIPQQPCKKQGLLELKQVITSGPPAVSSLKLYPEVIQTAINELSTQVTLNKPGVYTENIAGRLLENDNLTRQLIDEKDTKLIDEQQQKLEQTLGEDLDIIFADMRYSFIHQLLHKTLQKTDKTLYRITAWLDKLVLNRLLGIPIFLLMMYTMFFFAINVGGAFQDFFDISSNTLFVEGTGYLLTNLHLPTWLVAIIAGGAGKGINTTVTFIPVIGAMFLFLAFLEASGYMARAAFVMDRVMRALGLPGKSFVPMIIGFGCNVPAIMAARTLENKRDRILTVMMTPFMSCGARLAIYAVFTAAFFPTNGHNIVFALYLLGILMAIFTGLLLRKTLLKGEVAPLVLELPPYHVPALKMIMRQTWQRLKSFIIKAGKIIIPFCVVLGALNTLNTDGSLSMIEGNPHSFLAMLGQWLTPLFTPMGIQAENWPATVGLLTGILAKEVVIGSLNTLYTQIGHLAVISPQDFDLWQGLREAVVSVPQNLAELLQALHNPLLASIPEHSLQQGVYGEMYQRFGGPISAFSYLLFVLLYLPCVSTVAVTARELSRGWAIFATIWSTLLAYGAAVLFYQLATFSQHPVSSLGWVLAIVGCIGLGIMGLRYYGQQTLDNPVFE
ncbi:MAG: feoB [Gammaproteobacteria bacterium]|jgi:ferrous iron transport protein B|nr:feoB [Gammaproteobacteria bacterium]